MPTTSVGRYAPPRGGFPLPAFAGTSLAACRPKAVGRRAGMTRLSMGRGKESRGARQVTRLGCALLPESGTPPSRKLHCLAETSGAELWSAVRRSTDPATRHWTDLLTDGLTGCRSHRASLLAARRSADLHRLRKNAFKLSFRAQTSWSFGSPLSAKTVWAALTRGPWKGGASAPPPSPSPIRRLTDPPSPAGAGEGGRRGESDFWSDLIGPSDPGNRGGPQCRYVGQDERRP